MRGWRFAETVTVNGLNITTSLGAHSGTPGMATLGTHMGKMNARAVHHVQTILP